MPGARMPVPRGPGAVWACLVKGWCGSHTGIQKVMRMTTRHHQTQTEGVLSSSHITTCLRKRSNEERRREQGRRTKERRRRRRRCKEQERRRSGENGTHAATHVRQAESHGLQSFLSTCGTMPHSGDGAGLVLPSSSPRLKAASTRDMSGSNPARLAMASCGESAGADGGGKAACGS